MKQVLRQQCGKHLLLPDFLHAKAIGVKYVEVAFNQCYRGVPVDEVIPRIKEMKAKIDSADIEVWSIHLPFSRTLDISVLDDRLKEGKCRFYGRDDRIVCHVPTDLPGFASKFGTDSRQYSGATDCQCFGVYCLFEEIC